MKNLITARKFLRASLYFAISFLLSGAQVAASVPRTSTIEQNLGALAHRNFVINPGAERNITTGITDSSTITTRTTSSPLEGVASFSITATSTSQNVDWATNTLDPGIINGQCEARWTISGNASSYTANVLINSVVVSTVALGNYSNPQVIVLDYACGDGTNPTVLRIASTASGSPIKVDSLYQGAQPGAQLGQVAQATVYGTASAFAAVSCNWSDNSGVFATPAADTDCLFPTVTGGLSAEATHLPGFNMNSAPPGQYIVTATFQGSASTGNSSYALWDGTTRTSLVEIGNGTNTSSELRSVTLVGVYNYTTAGNRTLNLQCRSGGNACEITANSAFMELSFTVQRVPSQSQIVDNQNVNTPWNSSLAFTFTNFGTVSSNSFVTSRVNDSLEVRGSMNAGTTVGTAGTINLPSGYVIDGSKLTAGNNIVGYMHRATSSSTAVAGSSTGPWFLFYDGSNTGSLFFADNTSSQNLLKGLANDVNSGDKLWFNFTVPIVGWGPSQTYFIPGSVSSSSLGQERMTRVAVTSACSSSPCTIASQTGSDISSITRTGTGQYTLNFTAGTWSAAPTCVAYPGNTSSVIGTRASATATTSIFSFLTFDNTFANVDIAFNVLCQGPK